MADVVRYPAVPLAGAAGEVVGEVTVEPHTGATTALVLGRPYASRPVAGRRRALDASFLELRRLLRRGGYRLQSCGACEHFRYSPSSRDLSAGLSGYCGRGHHEPGPASLGPGGPDGAQAPVVTLYFSCPEWSGRDERLLAALYARPAQS